MTVGVTSRRFEPIGPLPETPEWLETFTAAERPDLWEATQSSPDFESLWPEYNRHGDHAASYLGALCPAHAHLQVLLVDRRCDRVIGRGRSIGFRWDGRSETLPRGIDALGRQAVESGATPTAVSALAAEVVGDYQGRHLSRQVIQAMAAAAREAGLSPLVAPVRPNWKDRYPITPIDRYAGWRRADGSAFDPWIRVHERLGAAILRCESQSLAVTAPVSDWESWTGLEFPEDGQYIIPRGLAPLTVRGRLGRYWEPNVWMVHPL